MDLESGKKFSSSHDEIMFWRELAQKLKTELEECKEEAEEYQISSRELETELEAQNTDLERKNRELKAALNKMKTENESLREKLNDLQGASHHEVSKLEDDLAQVRAYKDELQIYVRELEQANDDLERGKRATVASLEEFELRLNQAIERNAFLESELDEKESLMETVQRLKDEARDMRQEMKVKRRTITSDSFDNYLDTNNSNAATGASVKVKPVQVVTAVLDNHKMVRMERGSGTPLLPPVQTPSTDVRNCSSSSVFGSPISASARMSALNLVGDLLRKVAALETKLSSCRRIKEPHQFGRFSSDSPFNTPRNRRRHLNRGTSLPQGQIS